MLDDCKGGYLLTNYLISLGHRDIVGVFKADDIQGQQRHKGYVRALQEAGIAYDPDKIICFHTEDRKTHPYELMRQMAVNRSEVPFTAVVAYNDQTAVNILQALEEEGLSCPEDISITGYDNSYLASSCKVPLTTIAHPQKQLGEMAAELLLQLIQNSNIEKEKTNIVIEPELVIRSSCEKVG